MSRLASVILAAHFITLAALLMCMTWCRTTEDSSVIELAPVIGIQLTDSSPSVAPSPWPRQGSFVVVLSHGKEDVTWIKALPYPAVIVTRVNATGELPPGVPTLTVPFPQGKEASAYIHFILQYYDSLPERMLFAHAHQYSWHCDDATQIFPLLDPWSHEFAGLSRYFSHYSQTVPTYHMTKLRNFWEYGMTKYFGKFTYGTVHYSCCGTFLVSRERVLAHPKEAYQHLYDWMSGASKEFIYMVGPDTIQDVPGGLEMSWQRVFGEPWAHPAPHYPALCPSNPKKCWYTYIDCDLSQYEANVTCNSANTQCNETLIKIR